MSALSSNSIIFITNALGDKAAGKELALAIQNSSKLSTSTLNRLIVTLGDATVAKNLQAAILGTKALSARDIQFLYSAFTDAKTVSDIVAHLAGGVIPGLPHTILPVPIVGQVATPTLLPAAGTYAGTQLVTVSSLTAGSAFHYTTNGSTPTVLSTLYTGPISVSSSETLKVIGSKSGLTNSAITSAVYTIDGAVQTPTFSPPAGSYGPTQLVTVSSLTAGATFYYTTNGSTPTVLSTLYTGPVSVAVSETLKALGTKVGFSNSAIGTAAYVITADVDLSPVNLLTAANYRILAKSGISNTTGSSITGDIAVSPIAATAITGFALVLDGGGQFSTSASVTGRVYAANYAAPTPTNLTQAVSDMQAAYTDAAGRTLPDFTELGSGNIGGLTLAPGLYKWSGGVTIPNNVTISGDADDVWIFQIAGTLDLSAAKQIILSGGALPQNIFWQVAGAVSIGVSSTFQGIVLGQTSIAVSTTATVHGRLLAQTAVTLDNDVVSA